MFQDDFAGGPVEAAAYGSPGVFEDPWFWLTAIAIGLMIAIFSWVGGRMRLRDDVERRRKGACEAIWKAINDRARTAASAPRHQVTAAAQSLADELRGLLGPVIALAPLGNKADALLKALDGKPVKGDASKGHGDGHGSGHADAHAPAGAQHGDAGAGDSAGAPAGHSGGAADASATSGSHIHINIGDRHYPGGVHKPDEKKPEDRKPEGPKNGVDIDAIRKAVLEFCDYWAHRDVIVGQLQDAQMALLKTPPPAPHGARHGAQHGGGHGPFRHGG